MISLSFIFATDLWHAFALTLHAILHYKYIFVFEVTPCVIFQKSQKGQLSICELHVFGSDSTCNFSEISKCANIAHNSLIFSFATNLCQAFAKTFNFLKNDALWHKNYIFVWEANPLIINKNFKKWQHSILIFKFKLCNWFMALPFNQIWCILACELHFGQESDSKFHFSKI